MKPIATARDLETVAQVLEAGDPQLARRVRGLQETMRQLDLVYAIPEVDTDDGTAYVLSHEPKPQAAFEVLYRSPIRQLANDAMVAWTSGEISEGRACELLQISREQLRAERMQALARVTGPIDEDELATQRLMARDALDTRLEELASKSDLHELGSFRAFWQEALADPTLLAAFENWRALCLPAHPAADDASAE
jgi:hypothetical protein